MVALRLSDLVPDKIKVDIVRMAEGTFDDLTLRIERLTPDEARDIIAKVIELEQRRTGDVLSPTEYGNRFSGLEFD